MGALGPLTEPALPLYVANIAAPMKRVKCFCDSLKKVVDDGNGSAIPPARLVAGSKVSLAISALIFLD